MHPCFTCQASTSNPKFCSRSCSARTNNTLFPKRKQVVKPSFCQDCGKRTSYRNIRCPDCFHASVKANTLLKTKRMVREKYGLDRARHRSLLYGAIRMHARKLYTKELQGSCELCGYSKHVQVAHIKPVSMFSDDSTIAEINSRSNIRFLCPNCHWEFDHPELRGLKNQNQQKNPSH